MVKPLPLEGVREFMIALRPQGQTTWPSILTSAWKSQDGRMGQVIVNYLPEPQSVTLTGIQAKQITFRNRPTGDGQQVQPDAGRMRIEIEPLSAVLVEYERNCD